MRNIPLQRRTIETTSVQALCFSHLNAVQRATILIPTRICARVLFLMLLRRGLDSPVSSEQRCSQRAAGEFA